MSDVKVKFEGSVFAAELDSDGDGQKSIGIKLHLSEAFEEAIKKFKDGEEVEPVKADVKSVELKFEGGKMLLLVDTDKDGEKLLEVEANLMEAIDEGMQKFKA